MREVAASEYQVRGSNKTLERNLPRAASQKGVVDGTGDNFKLNSRRPKAGVE